MVRKKNSIWILITSDKLFLQGLKEDVTLVLRLPNSRLAKDQF